MPMKSAMEYRELKGQRFENNKEDVDTTRAPSISHTRTPDTGNRLSDNIPSFVSLFFEFLFLAVCKIWLSVYGIRLILVGLIMF